MGACVSSQKKNEASSSQEQEPAAVVSDSAAAAAVAAIRELEASSAAKKKAAGKWAVVKRRVTPQEFNDLENRYDALKLKYAEACIKCEAAEREHGVTKDAIVDHGKGLLAGMLMCRSMMDSAITKHQDMCAQHAEESEKHLFLPSSPAKTGDSPGMLDALSERDENNDEDVVTEANDGEDNNNNNNKVEEETNNLGKYSDGEDTESPLAPAPTMDQVAAPDEATKASTGEAEDIASSSVDEEGGSLEGAPSITAASPVVMT
ncbi:hypothetical protein RI054_37g141120 [Pseudoscourfieldia marina]